MSINDTIRALRRGKEGLLFDADGMDLVADQLEQLQAENERLKASQQLGLYPIVKEYRRGGFEEFTCEECGHVNAIDNSYIEKDYWICPVCGKNIDGIFRNYCDNCGQKIERRDAE